MAFLVCMGAVLQCSFGAAPSSLTVLPQNRTLVTTVPPAANIMDNKPVVNILPFGMCKAPTNPTVIAATAAASGVFTQAPCVPLPAAPWAPGSPTALIANKPALNDSSKLMCTWAGVISVTSAGQVSVQVP